MSLRQTELNTFYGHQIYAYIRWKKDYCECEECAEIRPKIYKRIWREVKKSNPKTVS